MAARRSKQEIIKDLEARIQKLKEHKKLEKPVKITKESAGIADAIAAIEKAATQNNIAVSDVIKVISRIKRTGLRIEDSAQKSKE